MVAKLCKTCATCIQEDQLVLLADNTTCHINELCEDDIILGFDIITKTIKPQRVKTIKRTEGVLVTKYEHPTNPIICTPNHNTLNWKYDWVEFDKCFEHKLCLIDPVSYVISMVDIPSMVYIRQPAVVYNLKTELGNFIVNGYIVKGAN